MDSIVNDNSNGNGEEGPVDARSGMLRLQTELTDKIEPQDTQDLSHLCLTLENGHVQAGTLREEIDQRYGPIGLEVLAAAENPSQHYFSQKGFVITYRPEYIECLYGSMTTANLVTLKAALSWLVMHRRTPVANQISISWGAWEKDVFVLLPLVPVDWPQSCWWKMLDSGIVTSLIELDYYDDCSNDDDHDDVDISEIYDHLRALIPQRPLLKTTPDVMSLLAGVTRPVQVGQGYILCGPYSAMIPITRQDDGSILWHYERKEAQGPELRVDDLESLKSEWYQTFDLDFLINASAHIGWSREGGLLLGTDQHTHKTAWSRRARRSPPIQITIPLSYHGIFPLDPPKNYLRMINNSKRHP